MWCGSVVCFVLGVGLGLGLVFGVGLLVFGGVCLVFGVVCLESVGFLDVFEWSFGKFIGVGLL